MNMHLCSKQKGNHGGFAGTKKQRIDRERQMSKVCLLSEMMWFPVGIGLSRRTKSNCYEISMGAAKQ